MFFSPAMQFSLSYYDQIEIDEFEYNEEDETYTYPCPCGDLFVITKTDMENGEEIATCEGCSLIVKVLY